MYSEEHRKYLRKIKGTNFLVVFIQILIVIIFLLIWQFLSDKGIINSFISSSPSKVFDTIKDLYNTNSLFNNIWVTIYETLISFSIGTILGIIVAIVMWSNKFLSRVFDPFLTVLNSLPKVALGPIIIIWAGANISSIIIMALLISVIITIVTVYNGFENTDPNKIKLLKSFKASKYQILKLLILPNCYSTIISSLKINISMSLIGVIMGEFLVSKEGIGYLIMYGSQVFNLNLVISGIVILMIVSYVMYMGVVFVEKKLIKNN